MSNNLVNVIPLNIYRLKKNYLKSTNYELFILYGFPTKTTLKKRIFLYDRLEGCHKTL